jgi:hypothetical protein
MKVRKKRFYIILFVLNLLIAFGVVSAFVINAFDIKLSKPTRVYYEPDNQQNK